MKFRVHWFYMQQSLHRRLRIKTLVKHLLIKEEWVYLNTQGDWTYITSCCNTDNHDHNSYHSFWSIKELQLHVFVNVLNSTLPFHCYNGIELAVYGLRFYFYISNSQLLYSYKLHVVHLSHSRSFYKMLRFLNQFTFKNH